MHTMAILGADFVCEGRRYVREHSDDLRFTGFNVTLFKRNKENGDLKQLCGATTCYSQEAVSKHLKKYFANERYGIVKAVVRNNADRTEKDIWKEDFL